MSNKKTAIITGASGGIGSGLVEAFVRAGLITSSEHLSNISQSLTASPRDGSPGWRYRQAGNRCQSV